jgi:hypothetical protein
MWRLATINGHLGSVPIATSEDVTRIADLRVVVLRDKTIVRKAFATRINVPARSASPSDCACHGVTVRYDPATGGLCGVSR